MFRIMRVLGVDPGSRFLGYGLVEAQGAVPRYLAHGVVKAGEGSALELRLEQIFLQLGRVIETYAPQALAVEGVFTHKNARSALVLGHARGVVLLLAARAGVPVFEYAPARVKRAIGSGGNDSKDSVARMVTRLLHLAQPLERADAYDALAVACCHAHQARVALHGLTSGASRSRRKTGQGNDAFTARLTANVVRAAPDAARRVVGR